MPNQSTQFSEVQTQIVTATPVDAEGNVGVMNGGSVPSASSSNTASVTVSQDPTGLITTLTAHAPGTAIITLSGQAPGPVLFSSSFNVTVTGGPAVGFTFSFAPPTP
jgi:hypothetical protein